jgi:hypothetical protein
MGGILSRPIVNTQVKKIKQPSQEALCSICQSNIENKYTTSCGHNFCKDCILGWVKHHKQTQQYLVCPNCKGNDLNMIINNKPQSINKEAENNEFIERLSILLSELDVYMNGDNTNAIDITIDNPPRLPLQILEEYHTANPNEHSLAGIMTGNIRRLHRHREALIVTRVYRPIIVPVVLSSILHHKIELYCSQYRGLTTDEKRHVINEIKTTVSTEVTEYHGQFIEVVVQNVMKNYVHETLNRLNINIVSFKL